jgi:hypothetical protein
MREGNIVGVCALVLIPVTNQSSVCTTSQRIEMK